MDTESLARSMAAELGRAYTKTTELAKLIGNVPLQDLPTDNPIFKELDDGLMEIGCGILTFVSQISDLVEELAVGFKECGLDEYINR